MKKLKSRNLKRKTKGQQKWESLRKEKAKPFKIPDISDQLPWGKKRTPIKERQQRNVKRTIGKTKKYIPGAGYYIWVGKDITNTGWMKKTTFDRMRK
jgi:hypothetical protein